MQIAIVVKHDILEQNSNTQGGAEYGFRQRGRARLQLWCMAHPCDADYVLESLMGISSHVGAGQIDSNLGNPPPGCPCPDSGARKRQRRIRRLGDPSGGSQVSR
ncbi:hypothetical protein GCM10028812_06620 [Ancylobacter sonchi]